MSVEHLIKSHKDFEALLLFVCLLDSQNIPRNLLNVCKSDPIVDNFIYHLQKYSLLTNDSFSKLSEPTFSLHRSIQILLMNHLLQKVSLKKRHELLSLISNSIENYMNIVIAKEDVQTMKRLMPHLKAFLSHKNLLADINKAAIEVKLGCTYYYTHYHNTLRTLLENSLLILTPHSSR